MTWAFWLEDKVMKMGWQIVKEGIVSLFFFGGGGGGGRSNFECMPEKQELLPEFVYFC